MAASEQTSKGPVLSKAEYLKRYLGDSDGKQSKDKRKKKKRINPVGMGMKIVDDDVDWKQLVKTDVMENDDDDEEEAPVVAEIIDERPEEVKCLEEFRNSNKWRVVKATNEDYQEHQELLASHSTSSTETVSQGNTKKVTKVSRRESPDAMVTKRIRHDSPEVSPRKKSKGSPDIPPERHIHRDSPDFSPVRKRRHDSPDLSPTRKTRHGSPDLSPTRKTRHDSPDLSPARKKRHSSSSPSRPQNKHSSSQKSHRKGSSPSRRKPESSSSVRQRRGSDSDLSPPRLAVRRSSPTVKERRRRTRNDSESDLSPPRKAPHESPDTKEGPRMLSGGAAGLVSVDVLRREQEETRRRERKNQPLEDESRNVETVFRDKSGKRRDLELEREEQRRKEGEQAEKDLKYMQWGKGLVQGQLQQQNVEDALREAQKPLARHIDDEDLDRMLREQEREGDPMADMLRRKKRKDLERKGVKERPRYQGPAPPPNRFNIMPGYRWDGVDRSNGFEKKRYSRLADQKAAQEMAYKWSVEDM